MNELLREVRESLKRLIADKEKTLLAKQFDDIKDYFYARGALDTAYLALSALDETMNKYKREAFGDSE